MSKPKHIIHMNLPLAMDDPEAFVKQLPKEALAHAPMRREMTRPGEGALESYLWVGRSLLDASRNYEGASRKLLDNGEYEYNNPEAVAFARTLWPRHQAARVFEIPTAEWKRIMMASIRGINQAIEGQAHGKLCGEEMPEGWEESAKEIWKASMDIPLGPDALPFPHMFIGLREPGPMFDQMAALRYVEGLPNGHIQSTVLGWLITTTDDGEVEVIEMCQVWTMNDCYIMPCLDRHKAVWGNPASLAPFVVPAILALTKGDARAKRREHKVDLNTRFQFKQDGKRHNHRLLPKPFYTIEVSDALAERHTKEVTAQAHHDARNALAYRHDRSAHERVLVHRGVGEIDADVQAKLIKRGYKLWYRNEMLPDAMLERLTDRGHVAKTPEEWIAILAVPIRATIVGDEALPYIPGLRLGKVHQEPDGTG